MAVSGRHRFAVDLRKLRIALICGSARPGIASQPRIANCARTLRWLLLSCALCLVTPAGQAAAIAWITQDSPPGNITEGPDQGRGYGDQTVAAVLKNLARYEVARVNVPLVRELQMMKKGGDYCTRDLMQSKERQSFLRFTPAMGYVLPVGLVVRASDTHRFDHYADANHVLHLANLLNRDGVVLGVARLRRFGAVTDAVLAQVSAEHPEQIAQIYENNGTATLFKMLQARHVDAVLAYPTEETYLAAQNGNAESYYVYPIAESAPLIPVNFSCTLTQGTDAFFADLGHEAQRATVQDLFQSGYERWLPPYLLPLYRERLKASVGGGMP